MVLIQVVLCQINIFCHELSYNTCFLNFRTICKSEKNSHHITVQKDRKVIYSVFSYHLPNWMKNFTFSGLFFYLYLTSKGDQNTFFPISVIHLSKSIPLLNCNMTLIRFVFSRGDSALLSYVGFIGDKTC